MMEKETPSQKIKRKLGSLSFSGLITIIAVLMVLNIYLSLYGQGWIDKDLIYTESAMCFIALVSLGVWFYTLRSRLFSLVDAAREMLSIQEHPLEENRSREGIFSEMSEIAKHMGELHERLTYFATLSASITTMLDSLEQGILIISPDGNCSRFHSKACEDLLEISPARLPIADVLKIRPLEREAFDDWLKMLFLETIAFEDLADLAPQFFEGTKNRKIKLELRPIRGEERAIEGVLLIATDCTQKFESEVKAAQDRERVEMILKITQDREMFRTLIKKCRMLLSDLRASQRSVTNAEFLADLARAVHTIKGSAASFFVTGLVKLCHQLEDDINGDPVSKLNKFVVDFELELTSVLLRYSDLLGPNFESDGPVKVLPLHTLLEFDEYLTHSQNERLDDIKKRFFQNFICVPIREVISSYSGRMQDLAQKLGKQIGSPYFSGTDVRIYREANEDICFNLVHIFNNIVDHGIEPPEERRKAGKSPIANVRTDVQIKTDANGVRLVEIRISDDGRGVDAAKVRRKLDKIGKQHQGKNDLEVIQHIFDADFSTREDTNELSGRGVGLNALKVAVLARKGKIQVLPSIPYGTTFLIQVPEQKLCARTDQNSEQDIIAA